MALRDVARRSAEANNQGAYVRVYQFGMMQVVRWLVHFSLATAMYFDPVDQPVYAAALASIEEGVDLLDEREIAGVINLYGDTKRALCPIWGVYHCWFGRDDRLLGGEDSDPRYHEHTGVAFPDECLDIGMTDPNLVVRGQIDWRTEPDVDGVVRAPCQIDL